MRMRKEEIVRYNHKTIYGNRQGTVLISSVKKVIEEKQRANLLNSNDTLVQ